MAHSTGAEAERKLIKAIQDDRIGMLGLVGGESGHYQPMTAFWEEETNSLWFFTYRDTDLAQAAGDGAHAMFTFVDKGHSLWACIGGELHRHDDPARMDKFWNPVVAAWYPEGRDDPKLTLLHLKPDSGEVWINEKGPVRFGLDILKANATKTTPQPGLHEEIRFGGASH